MAVGTLFWNTFSCILGMALPRERFVTSKFRQNTLDGNVCYVSSVRNKSGIGTTRSPTQEVAK